MVSGGEFTINHAQRAKYILLIHLQYEKFNTGEELLDMKDTEIAELTNHCLKCFETELVGFQKRDPSDVKWLKTALHKGTSRDRANAGALLVQSNPISHSSELETLIGLTKNANKTSTESVGECEHKRQHLARASSVIMQITKFSLPKVS